jgi:hypothetical protein
MRESCFTAIENTIVVREISVFIKNMELLPGEIFRDEIEESEKKNQVKMLSQFVIPWKEESKIRGFPEVWDKLRHYSAAIILYNYIFTFITLNE